MTMRTYRYFVCLNGHHGEEKTSENDQPYSTMWESITTKGLQPGPSASDGLATYLCEVCGTKMTINSKP